MIARGLATTALLFAASCHGTEAREPTPPTSPKVSRAPTPKPTPPKPKPAPAATKPTIEETTPSALEDPRGELTRFFAALRKAENKDRDGRVLISQFGDSHTAGDGLTRRMRHRLQARFGNAGRGFLLPGKPLKHYYQRDVRYGSKGKWRCEQGWRTSATGPFGLGAVRVHSEKKNASLFVESCSSCSNKSVDTFELFYAKHPSGGRLEVRLDEGRWRQLATKTNRADPVGAYHVIKARGRRHKLTLRPVGDGPVNLYGVVMERKQPGVVVDSLGVVGARAKHLHALDWKVLSEQLKRRDPRLVVLQYGTNEAYLKAVSPSLLEKRYVELIGRIRKAAPSASILILGPPDVGMRRLPYKVCKKWNRKRAKLVAKFLAANKEPPAPDEAMTQGCRYHTPATLTKIIAAQRAAARKTGVAFFDSLAAMGGSEMMDAFHQRAEPVAYRDRVHFTGKGAAWWADLLLDQMLGAYDRWAKPAGSPEQVATSGGE